MANLFRSLIGFSLLMSFSLAEASQCTNYFLDSQKRVATEQLILSHSVYSPWYYNILKEKASSDELLTAFEKADKARLQVLSEELYENLVLSERLPVEPNLAPLHIEALNKSLIAIQKTKRFPMQVEVKEVSKRGKVWFARGATVLGGTAIVMSLFMPENNFSEGLAGVGALATSAGVVRFLLGIKSEEIYKQSLRDVKSFIMSEGETDSLSAAHNRFENKNGKLVESETNYEVHHIDGQYIVYTRKPS